ncbi:MAG: hypothetical protein ABFD20_00950 [Anaerolineales bacterium]
MPNAVVSPSLTDDLATLPDPLVCVDRSRVTSAAIWTDKRRPEILRLFSTQMYGRTPDKDVAVSWVLVETNDHALGGQATRKQVVGRIAGSHLEIDLLLYLPDHRRGPVPVFLGLNFHGNHTVSAEPEIRLAHSWVPDGDDHTASEDARGQDAASWPIGEIIARGYGVATVYCGDLDPDDDDGFQNGIHPLFYAAG